MSESAPHRLCCGTQHFGNICPDGLVMCCLCFSRVSLDKLHVLPNGEKEDVCFDCAEMERKQCRAIILSLRAEVERLRMALEKIAYPHHMDIVNGTYVDTARDALAAGRKRNE